MLAQGDIVAGRYQIEEYLENLTNGWFYRAYDMRENQTVLLKWYSEIPGNDGTSWTRWHDRYVAEISVADKLNHPSIARLLDYGEAKDYSYIILEYDSSRTLKDLLTEKNQLSIKDSLQYALEIADALSRVHHIGKLHGDIQPAAVLLYVDGVRIEGFGLSVYEPVSGMIIGTPPYVSPEVAKGLPRTMAHDVWALGITLYEMLCGKPPFDDNDAVTLLNKIIDEPLPDMRLFVPAIPPRLIALIHWMLEKDQNKRLSSMRQVAAELEAMLQDLKNPDTASSFTALEQGNIIGERYRLQKEIGVGGFGRIFRAADIETGQTVAIKQLKPEIAGDPEHLKRFQREAETLLKANHPNIVKVLDTVDVHDAHYLVLEYVEGGDLRHLLEKKPLEVQKAVTLALEIADALTRAHHLHIIHRDIKPENVLIADDGSPRLTDFGIAYIESSERLTATGMVIGTTPYLAPEVLQGEAATIQSDIWSFGVLLYEMLTGTRPFVGEILPKLVLAILSGDKVDLADACSNCPVALVELLDALLERDVQKRLQSMREVSTRLEKILNIMDKHT